MQKSAADAASVPAGIGAVLLGAGFSRRFGSDKRLALLHGRSVAEVTCGIYTQAFENLRVVLRPEDDVLREKLANYPMDIIICQEAHRGMGHSLAAGFADLHWQWAFVGLLDMPFVQPSTLRLLIEHATALTQPAIVRPRLREPLQDGRPYGHPIGWHHVFFSEIRQCRGDTGARKLLHKHHADVVEVPLDDQGVVLDIDTPAELASQTPIG